MKIISIINAQTVRLRPINLPMRGAYLGDVIKAVQARYEFLQVPQRLEECDPIKGVTFLHGKFVNEKLIQINESGKVESIDQMVIDKFQFFSNGLQAEGQTTAENLSLFLDDITEWGVEEFKYRIHDIIPVENVYLTQLEVQLGENLAWKFELGEKISKKIEQMIGTYEYGKVSSEVSGFTITNEGLEEQRLRTNPFSIERRIGYPRSANVFFVTSPLKTIDLVELLKNL